MNTWQNKSLSKVFTVLHGFSRTLTVKFKKREMIERQFIIKREAENSQPSQPVYVVTNKKVCLREKSKAVDREISKHQPCAIYSRQCKNDLKH